MGRILVTGSAGFIGFHVAQRLMGRGDEVVGVDNLNDYYDVSLKEARLSQLMQSSAFQFERIDIADRDAVRALFDKAGINSVVHLAAQAGVRYSLQNPYAYIDTNLTGFTNILEGCRARSVQHLVYASSSSVYGSNTKLPFSVDDPVDHPVSLYAATKKANELMAHAYCHLFGIPATGLRFFTVYGPWGRPDMAMFLFASAILAGRPIEIFNNGDMSRDFTYVDDIVEGIVRVLDRPPSIEESPATSSAARHRVYNIGNHSPVPLMKVVDLLERSLGRTAQKTFLPMQAGDVARTFADVEDFEREFQFRPGTSIEHGIENFVSWYRSFYRK